MNLAIGNKSSATLKIEVKALGKGRLVAWARKREGQSQASWKKKGSQAEKAMASINLHLPRSPGLDTYICGSRPARRPILYSACQSPL